MTLSVQEISDRFEIQDMLFQYAHIIDQQTFDDLRGIFMEEAIIDYTAVGGPKGTLEEIITFLKSAMIGLFPNTQHLNANIQLTVDGDKATGRVMCFNPQELALSETDRHLFMLGIWYNDEYCRTESGWRIQSRSEEKSWVFNAPEGLPFD